MTRCGALLKVCHGVTVLFMFRAPNTKYVVIFAAGQRAHIDLDQALNEGPFSGIYGNTNISIQDATPSFS